MQNKTSRFVKLFVFMTIIFISLPPMVSSVFAVNVYIDEQSLESDVTNFEELEKQDKSEADFYTDDDQIYPEELALERSKFDYSVEELERPVVSNVESQIIGDYVVSFAGGNQGSQATILDYLGTETDLHLPSHIRNEKAGWTTPSPVTIIENDAFRKKNLNSVVIPSTVTTIGYFTFSENQLSSVDIPESVTTLGMHAFSDNQLSSVTIPSSIGTHIQRGVFSNNQLSSVTIPSGVTRIGSYAFSNNQLSSVNIPQNVTRIESYAFSNNQLSSVTIPSSVTTIEVHVFSYNRLSSVDIPESVTRIDGHAFNKNQLSSVTIPSGVTRIGSYAFSNNQLSSVTIPSRVTTIDNYAFSSNRLSSVYITQSVTTIGLDVFSGSPLQRIVVTGSNLENMKDLLTANVMGGVSELTKLETEEGFNYTAATQTSYNLFEGDSLNLEIEGEGYQLKSTQNRTWLPIFIAWQKGDTLKGTGTKFEINDVSEEDSGIYYATVGEDEVPLNLEDIEVTVNPRYSLEIPDINPENPVLVPESINPKAEGFDIRYVPSFDFGEIEFNSKVREVRSKELKDSVGTSMPHMVTIQDAREVNQRSGWKLYVTQESLFMDGAEIILNPYVHETTATIFGVTAPNSEMVITNESKVFASANGMNGHYQAGVFSIGLSDSANEGIRLVIPENVGIGTYETSLMWNLVSGP